MLPTLVSIIDILVPITFGNNGRYCVSGVSKVTLVIFSFPVGGLNVPLLPCAVPPTKTGALINPLHSTFAFVFEYGAPTTVLVVRLVSV